MLSANKVDGANGSSIPNKLKAVIAFHLKLFGALTKFTSAKPEEPSAQGKWDVRVASPRKLFRALHDLLTECGYEHEYEPLKTDRDAISDVAIFDTELIGKKDYRERDLFRIILGVLLLFTIILIPLAIRLLKASRYSLRTIAKIGVEGEAYRTRVSARGTPQTETLDVVSDARVTLDVSAGVAEGDYEISRPAQSRRELARIAEERQEIKNSFEKLLSTKTTPILETSKV